MPIIIAVVAIVAIIGAGMYFTGSSTNTVPLPSEKTVQVDEVAARTDTNEIIAETEVVTVPEPENDDSVTEVASVNGISGTYSASANYLTPARTEHEVGVTLTIADGIVTGADVVYDNSEGYSNNNQQRFDDAFEVEVVGKSLDEINLSRIGGASLTSGAFNDAVAEIRAEAEASA